MKINKDTKPSDRSIQPPFTIKMLKRHCTHASQAILKVKKEQSGRSYYGSTDKSKQLINNCKK